MRYFIWVFQFNVLCRLSRRTDQIRVLSFSLSYLDSFLMKIENISPTVLLIALLNTLT
jgi:hypothetical protein